MGIGRVDLITCPGGGPPLCMFAATYTVNQQRRKHTFTPNLGKCCGPWFLNLFPLCS